MKDTNQAEENIQSFFDAESKRMQERHEQEGIPESMKEQIRDLTAHNFQTVLDVGSGPGTLLLELLEKDIPMAIGIDLSNEMNNIALSRIKEAGLDDKVKLLHGSFLSTEVDGKIDAISLHRVLCCHPAKEQMIEQSASYQPKLVTISILRDWKLLRGIVAVAGVFARIFNTYRPYIHSQKAIDQKFEEHGYQIKRKHKGFWWVTTTYMRNEEI